MPRDGRPSRNKILAAAKREFLASGFEKASIRTIAQAAGVTSAALYRHFESKETLFSTLVEPGITAMNQWSAAHEARAWQGIEDRPSQGVIDDSEIDMMREVVLPNRECFKLLVCCSRGTRYEDFIHDVVRIQQDGLKRALAGLRAKGYPAAEIPDETLHMLLSAYVAALFEPIVHDYPLEKLDDYFEVMERFFLPGWTDILGIKGP